MFKANPYLRLAGVSLCAFLLTSGCSKPLPPTFKQIPAGKEFSGFLSDYANLKPSPTFEGQVLTFAQPDAEKNLRRYVAIIVDPVETYVTSDASQARLDEDARASAVEYFRAALVQAVSDAFPVVYEKGPLVLRLRSALVGVDAGSEEKPEEGVAPETAPRRALNINKVAVEMELVDSQTNEQIAAMVDRANLGAGAEAASLRQPREEKFRKAREAFDEWASRVRQFLDSENEIAGPTVDRVDKSYRPYNGL
jgi:hypothetical protein